MSKWVFGKPHLDRILDVRVACYMIFILGVKVLQMCFEEVRIGWRLYELWDEGFLHVQSLLVDFDCHLKHLNTRNLMIIKLVLIFDVYHYLKVLNIISKTYSCVHYKP